MSQKSKKGKKNSSLTGAQLQKKYAAPASASAAVNVDRVYYIDILKCVSVLGVVFIHIAADGLSSFPIGGREWDWCVFFASLMRFCVPVFFMCSGALFLNAKKNISTRSIYFRYMPRIVIALFFWSFAYELFDVFVNTPFYARSRTWLTDCLIKVCTFNTHFHMYYLYMIVIFYVFVPILKPLVNNADKSQMTYALAVWFVLGIFLPFMGNVLPETVATGVPLQYPLSKCYSAIGYGAAGYYIDKYPIKRKWVCALVFLISCGSIWWITRAVSVSSGQVYTPYLEGMSPLVAFMSISLFALFRNIFGVKSKSGAVVYFAKASFCVYLVHDFFNMIFRKFGFNVSFFEAALSIPLTVVLNIMLCLAVYELLKRIPFVKKTLV